MSHVRFRAASTLSRRRLLFLSAGGTLAVVSAGRLPAAAASTPTAVSTVKGTFLDSGIVHDIAVTYDQGTYDTMVQTYADTGDKEWMEATVAIDGATYARTGMRLKGNSSLMGLGMELGGRAELGGPNGGPDELTGGPGGGPSADEPERLPWLIRLDKYENDQQHDGITELVIRSNPSTTSLNEAVSLELLARAGLASQQAAATAFRVNGGAPALRLSIEHPNAAWMAVHFSADGLLYKSEATGDWSYRGDAPTAYKDAFDLEAGGTGDDATDLAPLIAFLDFVNNSEDATFAAELPDWLEVDQFAIYLAMMELIGNFDGIDGPGNNAYLYYDPTARRFTVVPWDMNLAFVGMGTGVRRQFPADGQAPDGSETSMRRAPSTSGTPTTMDVSPPDGQEVPDGPIIIDGGRQPNPLVERFNAVGEFAALVDEQSSRLRADLYDNGAAAAVLARWVSVLESGASGMVDQATIRSESEEIAKYFAPPE